MLQHKEIELANNVIFKYNKKKFFLANPFQIPLEFIDIYNLFRLISISVPSPKQEEKSRKF